MNDYSQAADKVVAANAAVARGQSSGSLMAGRGPAPQPSADTFTGQMSYLDEIIKHGHELLLRITKQADQLVPDNADAPNGLHNAGIGKIAPGPDSGPLLFRIQNRAGEIMQLHSAIARQLSRIDQVL